MRISRSGLEVSKKSKNIPCPKCRNITLLYVMNKMSYENLGRIDSEIRRIKPGEMFLPEEIDSKAQPPGKPLYEEPNFLEIETSDNVYFRLANEINTCVENDAFSAAFVMVRKLVENLLIAILRAKHGLDDYEIYFDDDSKQFRPLRKLIREFENDFDFYRKFGLKKEHMSRIKRFKGIGNHSAHNIVDLPTKSKLLGYKKDANDVIILLMHLLNRVEGIQGAERKHSKRRK